MLCRLVCRRGDIKRLEELVLGEPVVLVAERPCRRRLLYQDTVASLKGMEEGSDVLCRRFVSRMFMRVVPVDRGVGKYLAEVGSRRDLMMFWRPGGWQRMASLLMMHALSKLVVAYKWYVLMAIFDTNRRHC